MSPQAMSVALVLDEHFGTRVLALADRMPVWILSSNENDAAVAVIRNSGRLAEVTVLLQRVDERPVDTLARAVYSIEEHYGDQSATGPFRTLLVYGATAESASRLLTELGFGSIVTTVDGFVATKLHNGAA